MNKEGRIEDKTYKTKVAYKKGVVYKIDYCFATRFMHAFGIAAFHMVIMFGRDDFGMFFLWCSRHNFFVGVLRFIQFLLLLMLLFLLLLML